VRRAGRVAALALPLSSDPPASSAAPNAFFSIQSLTLPSANASSIVAGGGSASAAATIGVARITAAGFGGEEPAEAFSPLFILAFLVVGPSSAFGGAESTADDMLRALSRITKNETSCKTDRGTVKGGAR